MVVLFDLLKHFSSTKRCAHLFDWQMNHFFWQHLILLAIAMDRSKWFDRFDVLYEDHIWFVSIALVVAAAGDVDAVVTAADAVVGVVVVISLVAVVADAFDFVHEFYCIDHLWNNSFSDFLAFFLFTHHLFPNLLHVPCAYSFFSRNLIFPSSKFEQWMNTILAHIEMINLNWFFLNCYFDRFNHEPT